MNTLYHELVIMPQQNFPIKIFKRETDSFSIGCEFHWHKQIEFYYIERGGLQLLCSGEKQWVYSNDIAIVNCYEPHRSLQFLDDTIHYCLQIDLSLLSSGSWDICEEKYVKPLINSKVFFSKLIHEDIAIVSVFRKILKEYKSQEFGYELSIKSSFMDLFTLLLRNYCIKKAKDLKLSEHSTELNHIRKITNYISENFNTPITLQLLAQRSCISVPYMCRIFKKYTGSTIVEYINLLRCQKALSLLAGGYTITDAALSVGFNDSNYFSRTFKKVIGVSPSKAVESEK